MRCCRYPIDRGRRSCLLIDDGDNVFDIDFDDNLYDVHHNQHNDFHNNYDDDQHHYDVRSDHNDHRSADDNDRGPGDNDVWHPCGTLDNRCPGHHDNGRGDSYDRRGYHDDATIGGR